MKKKTQFVAEDAQSCKAGAIKYNLRFFLQEKYAPFVNVPMPTKEDFDYCDIDQDGVLLFDEWQMMCGVM